MRKSLTFTPLSFQQSAIAYSPHQVFSSPVWWIALLIFVLNDHVFKGGDLLPSVVTGKLSDFTGLFFAPPLFAAICRVKTKQGLFFTYLFTGLIFGLLNTVPIFSEAIIAFGNLTSIELTSTTDPTDLLTLPTLFLSWSFFIPYMQQKLLKNYRSWVIYPSLFFGSLSVMGTPAPPTYAPDLLSPFVIGNQTGNIQTIQLRYLKDEVDINCDFVSQNPSRFLIDEIFGDPENFLLYSGKNLDLRMPRETCNAVLFSGSGIEEKIIFWNGNDYPLRHISSALDEALQEYPRHVLILEENPNLLDAILPLSSSTEHIIFDAPHEPVSSNTYECIGPPVGAGVDWWNVPTGVHLIEEILGGLDGCHQINGQWFICMPGVGLPFQVGDSLTIENLVSQHSVTGIRFRTDEHEIVISRGDNLPAGELTSVELPLLCNSYHDACGQWVSPSKLEFRYQDSNFEAIAPQEIVLDNQTTLYLIRSEKNAIVNFSCASQYLTSTDSPRIEVVVVRNLSGGSQ